MTQVIEDMKKELCCPDMVCTAECDKYKGYKCLKEDYVETAPRAAKVLLDHMYKVAITSGISDHDRVASFIVDYSAAIDIKLEDSNSR